ncbi:TD and POZ domain-containing protein 5 isoform X2 [Agrilus planipennis]|uniref:TD and POZ domain-containing protein 5 isoform X2 n=1 Tax=Agrilus planipennis TaxID=224129 RepID=A0A7F5RM90_AGRPL|nr:TD and POZ domain-containing protein 5 isoform X2 [Agrilus planipennis]
MSTMPNHVSKKSKTQDPIDTVVGSVSEDLEVPVASEIVFRKIWRIRKFKKAVSKLDFVDSPAFTCSVNGTITQWNVSVRFWKGSNGKKVTNPVVLCLNLTGVHTSETGQARIRYQFGVWDANIRHWECSSISSTVLNLESRQDLLSIGYKSLGIHDRHSDNEKDVRIMIKIQIIHSEEEEHSLSQDLARILAVNSEEFSDTIIECASDEGNKTLKSHSLLIRSRSKKLGTKLEDFQDKENKNIRYKLDLSFIPHDVVQEFLRYIYTDKVQNAEMYACKLLPLSKRYGLPGLTALCERTLITSITPTTVPNILLLADECGCENLRKAALHYCEDSEEVKGNVHIGKSLAWRVMEMVNPDLFLEACESIGSSSSNLGSTDLEE